MSRRYLLTAEHLTVGELGTMTDEQADTEAALMAATDAVALGELIVLPTDTVYGVGADAFKPEAVQRLLDAKGRTRQMPPPVLVSSVDTLGALVEEMTDDLFALAASFWPGALTVICRMQSSLMWDLGETQGTVAVRVPDHELVRDLLTRTGPLAVSSANVTTQPAATSVYEAERMLGDSVAVYLDGGVARSSGGAPSTIIDMTSQQPRVLRAGAIAADDLREVLPTLVPSDSGAAGA